MDPLQTLLGRRPAALLFDLDGTLVDSVPDLTVAVDTVLRQWGLPAAGEEWVRQWVGNGAVRLVQRALGFARGVAEQAVDGDELARAHRAFLEAYKVSNGQRSRLFPGVAEALAAWQRDGIPMAVVTNKPLVFVPHLLTRLAVAPCFATALGGESVPTKKPAPDMLVSACRELRVDPRHCVMIGDSRNDVVAARAAGMPVVAVNYGYNHGRPVAAENPDRVVGDLRELLNPSAGAVNPPR